MDSNRTNAFTSLNASQKIKVAEIMFTYLLVYAGSATIIGYHVKYLDSVLGFSSGQIGMITSIGILIGIPFQPLIAKGADMMKNKNTMLMFTSLGIMAIYIPLLFPQTHAAMSLFGVALGSYSFMCTFRTAAFSLNDVVGQNYTNSVNIPYGQIRMMGSIGWSVGSLLTGFIVNQNLDLFPHTVIAIYIVLAVFEYFIIPKAPGTGLLNRKGEKISILKLIFRKELFPIYMMGGLSELGYATSSTFLVQYFEELGGNAANYGVYAFLARIVEVPVLLIADKVYKKKGAPWMLAFAAAVHIAKGIYLFASPNWLVAYFVVLINGFIVFQAYVAPRYISQNVEPAERAQAMAASTMMVFLIGAFGRLIPGVAIEYLFDGAIAPVMLINSLVGVGMLIFILITGKWLYKPVRDEKNS